MKYLNLGCGKHYSSQKEWTNIDFHSSGSNVKTYNLLNGIPYEDNSFDLVYHSHVLEHFTKTDGENFISECFRVLKPGGVLRIAVPDLEAIVRHYLILLNKVIQDPDDEISKLNYDWILLEMYDQATRNYGGGEMGKYLFQENIKNESFVFERIGEEGRQIRKMYFDGKAGSSGLKGPFHKILLRTVKEKTKKILLQKLRINQKAITIGAFRLGGEVHQWMYDRYSLTQLLTRFGGKNIKVTDAYTSFIDNWVEYKLDVVESGVRKPDSIFVEGFK